VPTPRRPSPDRRYSAAAAEHGAASAILGPVRTLLGVACQRWLVVVWPPQEVEQHVDLRLVAGRRQIDCLLRQIVAEHVARIDEAHLAPTCLRVDTALTLRE